MAALRARPPMESANADVVRPGSSVWMKADPAYDGPPPLGGIVLEISDDFDNDTGEIAGRSYRIVCMGKPPSYGEMTGDKVGVGEYRPDTIRATVRALCGEVHHPAGTRSPPGPKEISPVHRQMVLDAGRLVRLL